MGVRVVVARRRGRASLRARGTRRSAGRRAAAAAPRSRTLPRARRDRPVGLLGLRREAQVDRALRERPGALRHADLLHRLRRRDGERQRLRVGVADVLAGEDHHPPGDELRVLAALDHHREVVERGVGVRAARRLDPGGDRVVVLVAALVEAHGAPLQRVLGERERHRLALAGGRGGELERLQRGARVAAGARGEEAQRLVVDAALAGAALGHRAAQHGLDVVARQRVQLVDLRAREQRGVDLEVRVLGRRADQRDQALLDRGQQHVLLGLVEAVDLVEEEDGAAPPPDARRCGGALEDAADLRAPGLDGAQLLERRVGGDRDDPRERRLARPRRAVEDHRVRAVLLDRGAQRRALARAGGPARRRRRASPGRIRAASGASPAGTAAAARDCATGWSDGESNRRSTRRSIPRRRARAAFREAGAPATAATAPAAAAPRITGATPRRSAEQEHGGGRGDRPLPGEVHAARQRDERAEDRADRGGPGAVEERARVEVLAQREEPPPAEQDERERRGERDRRRRAARRRARRPRSRRPRPSASRARA